jgi:hypothetical protein
MEKKKNWPKKWIDVYPVGTKEGNEEARFFRGKGTGGLARHKKYGWRSTSALAKESGLSQERVEQILEKYMKLGMVFQNNKNPDLFAYWERVPEQVPDRPKSIAQKDKEKRISRSMHIGGLSAVKNDLANQDVNLNSRWKVQYKDDKEWVEIKSPSDVADALATVMRRKERRNKLDDFVELIRKS